MSVDLNSVLNSHLLILNSLPRKYNESDVKLAGCIKELGESLTKIDPDQIHQLRREIKAKILAVAFNLKGPASQDLTAYLDDDSASVLQTNQAYQEAINKYYCAIAEEKLSLHSNHLEQAQIVDILMKLPPDVKGRIRHMDLSKCSKLNDLSFLRSFPDVTRLKLDHCNKLNSLKGIEYLTHLETLDINGCLYVQSLNGIEKAKDSLTASHASNCTSLNDISALQGFAKLVKLDLSQSYKLGDPQCAVIASLVALENLKLAGLPLLSAIGFCEALKKLNSLDISRTDVSNLNPLMLLPKLDFSKLGLENCAVDAAQLEQLRKSHSDKSTAVKTKK